MYPLATSCGATWGNSGVFILSAPASPTRQISDTALTWSARRRSPDTRSGRKAARRGAPGADRHTRAYLAAEPRTGPYSGCQTAGAGTGAWRTPQGRVRRAAPRDLPWFGARRWDVRDMN